MLKRIVQSKIPNLKRISKILRTTLLPKESLTVKKVRMMMKVTIVKKTRSQRRAPANQRVRAKMKNQVLMIAYLNLRRVNP